MIDLGPSNPEEGTKDWETSKGESLRHPIQTEMSSNSYASVPWDAVSRVKFRVKSELQRANPVRVVVGVQERTETAKTKGKREE